MFINGSSSIYMHTHTHAHTHTHTHVCNYAHTPACTCISTYACPLCCSMCLTTSQERSLGVWLTLGGSLDTAMFCMDLSVMVLLACCLRVPLYTPTLVCCDSVSPWYYLPQPWHVVTVTLVLSTPTPLCHPGTIYPIPGML